MNNKLRLEGLKLCKEVTSGQKTNLQKHTKNLLWAQALAKKKEKTEKKKWCSVNKGDYEMTNKRTSGLYYCMQLWRLLRND